MKKLIILALAFASMQAMSQGFEGTIKWTMKMDVTDPDMKAKMDEGEKQMQDPAKQAKMQAAMAQMNDPKMKAMMESNPAMKEQMEKMMKGTMSGKSMMPSGFTIKIKGGNHLSTMEGGMMSMETLFIKDQNKMVSLNRENKTYSVISTGGEKGPGGGMPKPTVTKTSETMKILNYNCTKYVVTINERGQTITQNIWTTTDIKDIDFKSMTRSRVNSNQSLFYDGMEGMPLRIESKMQQGGMVMEVASIQKESLDASLFSIPSGFTETKGMFEH